MKFYFYYTRKWLDIKILCFDQSTKKTGCSIWENKNLITYGVLEVNEKDPPIERLYQMYFQIKNLIENSNSNFVALEGVQFQNNYKTYSLLSQLQGLIFSTLFERDLSFVLVEPTVWKAYCGIKGKKREEQKINTIQMVRDKFNLEMSEDEADAIGLGWYTVNNIKINNEQKENVV